MFEAHANAPHNAPFTAPITAPFSAHFNAPFDAIVRARHGIASPARQLATLLACAASLSVALPAAAEPRTAVTVERVHLRSGPGRQYPSVRVLPAGLLVEVQGCLSGFTWCDVIADADRGWVHGQRLQFDVEGRSLRAPEAGTLLGLTLLGFVLGHYRDDPYHDRPWYGQRYRWAPPPAPPRSTPPPLLRWLPPGTVPQPPHTPPHPMPPPKPSPRPPPPKPAKEAPREPVMPKGLN